MAEVAWRDGLTQEVEVEAAGFDNSEEGYPSLLYSS